MTSKALLSSALFALANLIFLANGYGQSPGPGQCIGFNGVSQALSAPSHASYLPDNAFTAEAWIFPYTIAGTQNILGNYTALPSPQGFGLQIDNSGNLALQTSQGVFSTSTTPITNSTWIHVAAVTNSSNVLLYINGELTATVPFILPSATTTLALYMGSNASATAPGYFSGELDEIRIWNQALSQNEIRDWMCRKVTPTHPAYANLTGYWRLDETSGNTANDLSPLGNHASLINAPMRGYSGAPIGDFSFHAAPTGLPNGSLFANGDTLWIDNASGSPLRVHGYRVDESPYQTSPPNGYASLDTSHYYGIFLVGGSNPTVNGRFGFGGNVLLSGTDACNVMVAVRQNGSSFGWGAGAGIPDNPSRRLQLNNYPSLELIPGIRPHPHPVYPTPDDTVCSGETITLQTQSGASSYQWLLNGSTIGGANSNQITISSNGEYSVQTTLNGCAYVSDTAYLHFRPLPNVTFTLQDSICSDEGGLILNGGLPVGGWYLGVGVSGNQFDPAQSGVGLHSLSYDYTDSLGCSASATANIYVGQAPTASMGALPSVCQLDPPVSLTSGSPAGGVYFGLGVGGALFDPSLVGPGQWQIDYILTTPQGCDDTASTLIDVLPAPITPSVSVAGNTLFSSSASGNQWYDLSGPIAGATGQAFTPTVDGTYYVLITDQNGCLSDTSNLVPIIANSLTPSASVDLELFPIPADERVHVSWLQLRAEVITLRVWDQTGRIVWTQQMEAEARMMNLEIELANWADGLYWLQVGVSKPVKLMKMK